MKHVTRVSGQNALICQGSSKMNGLYQMNCLDVMTAGCFLVR
jgi:hypothetical protein